MARFEPIMVSGTAVRVPGLSQAYWLLALAMLLTVAGVFAGSTFALPLFSSGWIFLLLIVELVIIISARAWIHSSPLNYVLFAAFPFLSGLTITPFILSVATGYANGTVILLNATIATCLIAAASAVYAATAEKNLAASWGMFLFQALIGLLLFGILQLFVPSLRAGGFELFLSGAGIVVFALFLAVDIQRLVRSGRAESPFLLALSLYLDIFNLFLYVVRFMVAMSGRRQ